MAGVSASDDTTGVIPEWQFWKTLRFRRVVVFGVCLSYSHLCFQHKWSLLQSRYLDFFRDRPIDGPLALRGMAALLCDIGLLTLVLWGAFLIATHNYHRRLREATCIAFVLGLALPLNVVRTDNYLFSLRSPTAIGMVGAAMLAAAIWYRRILRPVGAVVLILLPLIFLQIGAVVYRVAMASTYPVQPLAPKLAGGTNRPKVIWVIFDEMDQRVGFLERPASLAMPAFDRLRSETLYGDRVSRAGRNTITALPSLLLGRAVTAVQTLPPADMNVTFADDGSVRRFSALPNCFSLARRLGLNVAVAGWYIPYCRMFAGSLTACEWAPTWSYPGNWLMDPGITFAGEMRMIFMQTAARLPGLAALGYMPPATDTPETTANHIKEYRVVMDSALRAVNDPGVHVAFLHFPIPHRQGIYDRKAGRVAPAGNYFDNLLLTDRTLAELRQAMERAGTWDRSIILISSDHSYRVGSNPSAFLPFGEAEFSGVLEIESPWVPFFLKLPGQTRGMRLEKPFNAVISRNLLLAALNGGISSPEAAREWIEAHAPPGN